MEIEVIEKILCSIESRVSFYRRHRNMPYFKLDVPEIEKLNTVYEDLLRQWVVEVIKQFEEYQQQSGYNFR